MAQYSVGDALKKIINEASWKQQYYNAIIKENWNVIAGDTIAKYTSEVKLVDTFLVIKTPVAALKYELMHSKQLLIDKTNEFLGLNLIKDIVVS